LGVSFHDWAARADLEAQAGGPFLCGEIESRRNLLESNMEGLPVPREIQPQPKAYAFERSLGIPPAEACRRAGGKVENGQATKWENNKRVQAWIAYYRACGLDEAMIAAKRARIEERLERTAFVNIFDFATIEEMPIVIGVDDEGEPITKLVKQPVIDWEKVAASPYGSVISGFKFHKDTGRLTDFDREDALQAVSQLRDMHGFKAPAKTELTGKNGSPIAYDLSKLTNDQLAALEGILAASGGAAVAR
jgi:hypothetical protein